MAVYRPLVITSEGRRALQAQLASLYRRRTEVAAEMSVARAETDLTESSSFFQAREEHGLVEGRIVEVEAILREAREMDATGRSAVVRMGSRVVVADASQEIEYHLVDPFAVDPGRGRISIESPVGKALIGARRGDRVVAETPGGPRPLRVVRCSESRLAAGEGGGAAPRRGRCASL